MGGSVIQVKDRADFQSHLEKAGNKLVVVDFYATWCGPCKMIAPKLAEMSTANDNIVFLKVDVDECEDIAQEYGISAMPTFILIKNSEKVDSLTGANIDKLREKITTHA